jgi:hypothetical protein
MVLGANEMHLEVTNLLHTCDWSLSNSMILEESRSGYNLIHCVAKLCIFIQFWIKVHLFIQFRTLFHPS